VRLKSNVTGATRFFLLTTELKINIIPVEVVPLGSHTPVETLFPPGSSAGSLHVEVPSDVMSCAFGCCPQFQNDDLW
jgi:hypothetical protein